jgi:hypothetical protein
MKNFNLSFIFLFTVFISLIASNSYSHVIPEDELRNKVYLSNNEALKKVFKGITKIKREKHKISPNQRKQIEKICRKNFEDQRIDFYTTPTNSGKLYATIGKATANSHPITEAKFIILINSQGQIKDLHIMEYKGPQRAEIISRPFLNQFLGKSAHSDFKSVTSNQGTTPSAQALVRAVHKTLASHNVVYLTGEN